jgi:hypothetical protein
MPAAAALAPGPVEAILTLGPLDPRERHRVRFSFDGKYTTGMSCKLKFSCRVYLPTPEQLTGGRRWYAEKGKINYAEIVDMAAELLRMSIQAEMGLRWHSWRSEWDRKLQADLIASRLDFALRSITGLDFEIKRADILFVQR